jgi:hypothetical protein
LAVAWQLGYKFAPGSGIATSDGPPHSKVCVMMDNRVNRVISSKLIRDFTGFVARSIVYNDDLPIKAYAAQKPSCSF